MLHSCAAIEPHPTHRHSGGGGSRPCHPCRQAGKNEQTACHGLHALQCFGRSTAPAGTSRAGMACSTAVQGAWEAGGKWRGADLQNAQRRLPPTSHKCHLPATRTTLTSRSNSSTQQATPLGPACLPSPPAPPLARTVMKAAFALALACLLLADGALAAGGLLNVSLGTGKACQCFHLCKCACWASRPSVERSLRMNPCRSTMAAACQRLRVPRLLRTFWSSQRSRTGLMWSLVRCEEREKKEAGRNVA